MKVLSCFLLILCSLFISASPRAAEPAPSSPPAWNQKMQGLYQTLSELLTLVSSEPHYLDEKNHAQIETKIKNLSSFAHELSEKNNSKAHADPATQIFAKHLQSDAQEAYLAFHEGRKEYARTLIRSLTESCIACHSRNASGPHFDQLPIHGMETELKPIERARFFSASRQYDRSIAEYLKIIGSQANISPWEWEEAIKESLSLAVRVKKDPELSLQILNQILKDETAPYYLKQNAAAWKRSVEKWKKEPSSTQNETALFNEAKSLMNQAKNLKLYPLDPSADLLYLRASALLFSFIELAPMSPHLSEALYWQGICNESMSPRSFESLSRYFYEACIQNAPHTPTAELCFKKYEEQSYFAYTGSIGTHLPSDLKQKIADLKALAFPISSLKEKNSQGKKQ